jgi:hypothetical protein
MKGDPLLPAKAKREEENTTCVGGLRNPNRVVARSPHLRTAGKISRELLEELMMDRELREDALLAVDSIGLDSYAGIPEPSLRKARAAFSRVLHTAEEHNPGICRSCFQATSGRRS